MKSAIDDLKSAIPMTPENTAEIIADISRIPCLADFKEELIRGERARQQLSRQRQILMKQANDKIQRRFMEGLGAMVMNVDPDEAATLRLKYGFGCLSDPHFRKWILARRPEFGVQCGPGRLTLLVQGLRSQEKRGQRPTSNVQRPMSNGKGGIPDARTREGSAGHGAQAGRTQRRTAVTGDPATPFLSGHGTAGASLSGPRGGRTRQDLQDGKPGRCSASVTAQDFGSRKNRANPVENSRVMVL